MSTSTQDKHTHDKNEEKSGHLAAKGDQKQVVPPAFDKDHFYHVYKGTNNIVINGHNNVVKVIHQNDRNKKHNKSDSDSDDDSDHYRY